MPVLERDLPTAGTAKNAVNRRSESGGMEKAAFPVAAESATNQASLQAAWGLGCRPGWEAIAERFAGMPGKPRLCAASKRKPQIQNIERFTCHIPLTVN